MTNRPYARKHKLNWYYTKDFYNGNDPINPGDIPTPMLRHYYSLGLGSRAPPNG